MLVTSRTSLAGLAVTEAAQSSTLDLFTGTESEQLVRKILGNRRADEEPASITALIEFCARLPLALRVAATRIALRRHGDIADVVAEVRSRPWLEGFSENSDGRSSLRTVFGWSEACGCCRTHREPAGDPRWEEDTRRREPHRPRRPRLRPSRHSGDLL